MATFESGFSDKENVIPVSRSSTSLSVSVERSDMDASSLVSSDVNVSPAMSSRPSLSAAAVAHSDSSALLTPTFSSPEPSTTSHDADDMVDNDKVKVSQKQQISKRASLKARIRRTQLKMLADNLSKFYAPIGGGKRREQLARKRSGIGVEQSARERQLEVIRKQVSLVEKRKKAELEMAAAAAINGASVLDSSRVTSADDVSVMKRKPTSAHLNARLPGKMGRPRGRPRKFDMPRKQQLSTKTVKHCKSTVHASSTVKMKKHVRHPVQQTRKSNDDTHHTDFEASQITDEDTKSFALCQTQALLNRTAILSGYAAGDVMHQSCIVVGKHQYMTSYVSSLYYSVRKTTLFFCEFCFVPSESVRTLRRHQQKCGLHRMPGDQVCRNQDLIVLAVNGSIGTQFISSLNQMLQYFASHQSLWDDPVLYVYYILYHAHETDGCQFVGCLSKLKEPLDDNVSYTVVLPPYAECGYDAFLTELCGELESGGVSQSRESMLSPAMSVGKSVVFSYLQLGHTQSPPPPTDRNGRSRSPRSAGQSPESSPAKWLNKSCPCCVDSRSAARKRIAHELDDVTGQKWTRHSQDHEMSECSQACDLHAMNTHRHGAVDEIRVSKSSSVADSQPTGLVKRENRLRPASLNATDKSLPSDYQDSAVTDKTPKKRSRSGQLRVKRSVEHVKVQQRSSTVAKSEMELRGLGDGQPPTDVVVKRGRGRPRKHPLPVAGTVKLSSKTATAAASVTCPTSYPASTASVDVTQSAGVDMDYSDVEPDSSGGSVMNDSYCPDAAVSSSFTSSTVASTACLHQSVVSMQMSNTTTLSGLDAALCTSRPVFSNTNRMEVLPKSTLALLSEKMHSPVKQTIDICDITPGNGLPEFIAPVMVAESRAHYSRFLPATAAALCDTSTVSSPSFSRSLCAAISTSAKPRLFDTGDASVSVLSDLAQTNAVVSSSTPVMADVLLQNHTQFDQGGMSGTGLRLMRSERLTDHTELLNALLSQAQLSLGKADNAGRHQSSPNDLTVPVIAFLNLGTGLGSLPSFSCAAVLPPGALQFVKVSQSNESNSSVQPAVTLSSADQS